MIPQQCKTCVRRAGHHCLLFSFGGFVPKKRELTMSERRIVNAAKKGKCLDYKNMEEI